MNDKETPDLTVNPEEAKETPDEIKEEPEIKEEKPAVVQQDGPENKKERKKKKKKEKTGDIEVSTKHLPLRIAAFAIAVIAAVGFITYGIVMIGHKSEGYETVEPDAIDSTVIYSGNLQLNYYFTGNSDEIKHKLNELKNRYGIVINRAYKLLDSRTEYDDFNNIHTINTSIGTAVKVIPELYDVLYDAYAKTLEQKGFNMFAGALYREWNSILVLDEPLEYDPLNNENEAERIKEISARVNDLNNFELIFDKDAQTVKLVVSGNYKAFVNEYELADAPIIDLNLLYDAYELKIISESLEKDGFDNGYFTSTNGLSLSLSAHDNEAVYDFLYVDDGTLSSAANAKMTKGSAMSRFRTNTASEKEYFYYTVEKDGKTYLRNPFITADGEFNDVILSSYTLSDTRSVVDVCYANIVLHAKKTAADAAAEAENMSGICVAYILQADEKPVLYTNKAADGVIVVNPKLTVS